MKALFLLLLIEWVGLGQAAGQYGDLVRVRSGHSIGEEIPPHLRFRFEKFQNGQVFYRTGKSSLVHLFNYDYMAEAVLTIQITGDTIVLYDNKDFLYFKIKDAIFYRVAPDRYVEIIADDSVAKLAVRDRFIMKRRDKKVSDGYNTFVDNVNSVRSLTNMGYGRMIYDQDMLMMRYPEFYLVDQDGLAHKATKSRFFKLYPAYKESIERYIDRGNIDFKSRDGLLRLFEYCSELRKSKVSGHNNAR